MVSEPKQALIFSEQALNLSVDIGFQEGIADSSLNIGWCYNYLSQYDLSLNYLLKVLDLYRLQGDSNGEMRTMNAIGVVYHNLSEFAVALDYYTMGLHISLETGNRERELAALNNIGEVSLDLNHHEEAIGYFERALQIAEEIQDIEKTGNVLANIGFAYWKSNKPEKALEALHNALQKVRKANDRITEAKCLTGIGLIYEKTMRWKEAESYHTKSISLCDATGNKIGKIEAMQNLGQLYLEQHLFEKALPWYEEVLKLSECIKSKRYIHESCEALARIHEEKGKFEKALAYFKRHYVVEREVHTELAMKKLGSMAVQYEVESSKKEAEIYRLRNVELREKTHALEESNRQIIAISQIGQKITAFLDLEKVMNTVHAYINDIMDASVFGIALVNHHTEEIEYKLFIENGKRMPPISSPLHAANSFGAWCVRNKKHIFVNDVKTELHLYLGPGQSPVLGERAESLMYLPLSVEEKIIGLLTVQSFKKHAYTEQHLNILSALASYIAIALENSLIHIKVNQLNQMILEEKQALEEAYHKITHMAHHDNLTGLPNRRMLAEIVGQAIAVSLRQQEVIAFLYLDLDDFKPINDQYGHDAGDAMLKAVAKRLKGVLRSSDAIARIGGDEFVALLHVVKNRASVDTVVGKIIDKIGQPVQWHGKEYSVSVSIGIALCPQDDVTFEGLMKKADIAMYAAKRAKKNTYVFYNSIEDPDAFTET